MTLVEMNLGGWWESRTFQMVQAARPASLAEPGGRKGETTQDSRKGPLREVIPHGLGPMPQFLRCVHIRQDHTYCARSEKDLADGSVALGMSEEEEHMSFVLQTLTTSGWN